MSVVSYGRYKIDTIHFFLFFIQRFIARDARIFFFVEKKETSRGENAETLIASYRER